MDPVTSGVLDLVKAQLPDAGDDVDAPLAEVGLNSLHSVALLVALEQRFAVRFPPELIDATTFRTVRSMADAVRGALRTAEEPSDA